MRRRERCRMIIGIVCLVFVAMTAGCSEEYPDKTFGEPSVTPYANEPTPVEIEPSPISMDPVYVPYYGVWKLYAYEIEGYFETQVGQDYLVFYEDGTVDWDSYYGQDNEVIIESHMKIEFSDVGEPLGFTNEKDGLDSMSFGVQGIDSEGRMCIVSGFYYDNGAEMSAIEYYVKVADAPNLKTVAQKENHNEKKSQYDENEMKQILLDVCSTECLFWFYDDFNYDGVNEAFGIFGDYDYYDGSRNVSIWFIENSGEYKQVASDSYCAFSKGSVSIEVLDGIRKFLVWEEFAGGSGSQSLIYSVRPDGEVYELEVSRKVQMFIIKDNQPWQTKHDWSGGYHDYLSEKLYFDADSGEFHYPSYHEYDTKEVESAVTKIGVKFNADTRIDVQWGWNLFDKDSSEYSHDLALVGLVLSQAAEDGADDEVIGSRDHEIYTRYRRLGFDNIKTYNYSFNALVQPAHALASAEVLVGGKKKYIISMTVCGSRGEIDLVGDWGTNITEALGLFSYKVALQDIINDLSSYYYEMQKKWNCSPEDVIFFFTGHSLGGAMVSKIAGENLFRKIGAPQENTFIYAFAPPNYYSDLFTASSYTNVHNIVNEGDLVPYLNEGGKNGHNWYYDKRYSDSTFADILKKLYPESEYEKFNEIGGWGAYNCLHLIDFFKEDARKANINHDCRTYLALLLSDLPKNMGSGAKFNYSIGSIQE